MVKIISKTVSLFLIKLSFDIQISVNFISVVNKSLLILLTVSGKRILIKSV